MARADILIGTRLYAAAGEAAGRQAAAVASLRTLTGVALVNLQFVHAPHHVDGIRTLATLQRTSRDVARRDGPEKPLVSEMFDALAAEATALGLRAFCFTNGDIVFSQAAVDWIREGDRDAWVFSREEFDGATGRSGGMQIAGIDVIAVSIRWWTANRSRFGDYIVGESTWDNVYASILLCHANAAIENRRGLVRHEQHALAWTASPFVEYTRLLAAFDAGDFTLWCRYIDALQRLRAERAGPAQEDALARATFVWRPSPWQRMVQAGRNVKARVRYLTA